jgi:hypothetical protein
MEEELLLLIAICENVFLPVNAIHRNNLAV